jgi:neutral ceramidase
MSLPLMAGVAKTIITPPAGVDLCGFGNRTGPSVGVHDDLQAGALYLRREQEVIILTLDLIGLDRAAVADIRTDITTATGVPASHIMIGCSHTHSGPSTFCLEYLGKPNAKYLALLKQKLVEVAAQAKSQATPATLGTIREPVSVGINRRQMSAGQMTIGRNERGRVAPYVDVVAVNAVTGPSLGRLFVHAAHPVTLGGDNLLISADWPGYAQRTLEQAYGDGTLALFGQGCCGNINSDPRGSFEIAEAQGRVMAGAVLKAAEYVGQEEDWVIAAAGTDLQLPCFDPPTVAEAEALLAEAQANLAKPDNNYGYEMMYEGIVAWAKRMLALAQAGATGLTLPFEVQAIRIGDFGLVGLPGEVFVEYALNIDAGAEGYRQTATLGYANGNVGYVPTAAAHPEGGYEVDYAIRLYGDTMMTPDSEAMIVECALGLLRELRSVKV